MQKHFLFFLIATACFTSCSSKSIQTTELYNTQLSLTPNVENHAPYISQEIGHCGPATLAMSIAATGSSYNMDEIIQQVYSPGAKGSLQENMISAARRQGFLAIPITGLQSLLKEIENKNVVIVFENLGINLIPQWHYALVTGYNLKNKTLTMHSGPYQNQIMDMAEFELSWRLTNYWALLILPPGKTSVSADEITHLNAAAALEKLENLEAAKKSYLGILKVWPKSLIGHIGLGNVYYQQGDYRSTVKYLEAAQALYPHSMEVSNNLKVAKKSLKNKR